MVEKNWRGGLKNRGKRQGARRLLGGGGRARGSHSGATSAQFGNRAGPRWGGPGNGFPLECSRNEGGASGAGAGTVRFNSDPRGKMGFRNCEHAYFRGTPKSHCRARRLDGYPPPAGFLVPDGGGEEKPERGATLGADRKVGFRGPPGSPRRVFSSLVRLKGNSEGRRVTLATGWGSVAPRDLFRDRARARGIHGKREKKRRKNRGEKTRGPRAFFSSWALSGIGGDHPGGAPPPIRGRFGAEGARRLCPDLGGAFRNNPNLLAGPKSRLGKPWWPGPDISCRPACFGAIFPWLWRALLRKR